MGAEIDAADADAAATTLESAMTSLIANDEVQASRRARELYKYFTPPNGTLSTSKTTSPDSQLVALSQLVAYRLDCQRALISLIDRDLQYFVAEATKTVDLVDSSRYDDPDDAIWAGVSLSYDIVILAGIFCMEKRDGKKEPLRLRN